MPCTTFNHVGQRPEGFHRIGRTGGDFAQKRLRGFGGEGFCLNVKCRGVACFSNLCPVQRRLRCGFFCWNAWHRLNPSYARKVVTL